ncbi:NADP-dependent oxidoreductase [Sinirhodobacter populi]|uniref:NADP-dependent oxidoreductase n=1 Tax=Paenirhodobacter populi TaxID=2306993 RepID=A0A443K3V8_9RHOB|nr:NADP-dependent oxidoreductase [Sinirhodobacter populi]RWR27425.1 NADP-dependent oxidoreductase [Sinirhodobacter populi]
MKAVLLKAYGDTSQLEMSDIPTPRPQRGELLIKIEASAVNHFDLMIRQGWMTQFVPLELPAVLGGDAAGTVMEVGADVSEFSIGDRVIADFPSNGRGAHAEYGVVSATAVVKLPDNLTFEQGAALPKAGLTGRQMVDALNVKPGSRVIVAGALGAVGRAAIQYLKELGAQPVAGVRPERFNEARQLTDGVIDITSPATDASFDFGIGTAAPVAGNLISHIRDGGQLATVVPIPEGANTNNRVTIHDVYHRTDAAMLRSVAEAASRGDLIIPIARIFPLEELGSAQDAVASGAQAKIVLHH